jgi:RNA polymerase sigma factor (sigma-70 family)
LSGVLAMAEWIIGNDSYSTSALAKGIRTRDSEESRKLIELLKNEKMNNSANSVVLTFIDQIRRPYLDKYLRNPKYGEVPLSLCEESFNDGLLSVYTDIDTYDSSRSSFGTWIENKFHYAFLTNYRKWLRIKLGEESSIDDENATIPEMLKQTSFDISENIAQVDQIVKAFNKLSENDKELLRLVFSGETPTSISEKKLAGDVSIDAIKVAVFRARKRFSNLLIEVGWN